MKKNYIIIVMLAITTITTWAQGSLTLNEEGYYEIRSADDIKALADMINSKKNLENPIRETYKVMVEELDLSSLGDDFWPIGRNSDHQFDGTFDGQGVVIKNFKFKKETNNVSGLFGYMSGATIKNITFDESCSITGQNTVGALAGFNYGGTITNCVNKGKVEAKGGFVGGLIGQNKNLGEEIPGVVQNCKNYGSVEGKAGHVGGICGTNDGKGCEIISCENYGYIKAENRNVGGITGLDNKGKISNCINTANVLSNHQDVGGIVGQEESGTITNCKNSGNIENKYLYCGGIIGGASYSVISDCENTGDVISTHNGVGGIFGWNNSCSASNCTVSNCTIIGTYDVGALFGTNKSPKPFSDNFYFMDVTVTDGMGTYKDFEARGQGAGSGKAPVDVKEKTVDKVVYYNCAVLKLREGEGMFTVTYVIDGVTFMTESVQYGSVITPPEAPVKEGYDFSWEDYPETMPAEDITIQGFYTTGIDLPMLDKSDSEIFDVKGYHVDNTRKGIKIIKDKSGQTKKVYLK